MDKALRAVSRMERIQAPIVAVVGEWIRQTPGTISLGQGVVHYGPPAAAIDAVRAALGNPATSEYQPVAGLPALRERIAAKLAAENGIDVARAAVSWSPRAATWPSCTRSWRRRARATR